MLDPIGPLRAKTGEAYAGCRECQGTGAATHRCTKCDGGGRLRAQVVLTVVNADTGAIASTAIVPGVIDPTSVSDIEGNPQMGLELQPVVDDLCDQTGVVWLQNRSGMMINGRVHAIWLERSPNPFSEEPYPFTVTQGLARQQGVGRHAVFVGHSRVPDDESMSPDRELARLCQVAGLLCLDLLVCRYPVEKLDGNGVAHWGWWIAFAPPGSRLPDGHLPGVGFNKPLAQVLSETKLRDLLWKVSSQFYCGTGDPAPAYTITPDRPSDSDATGETVGSVDELSSRLDGMCAGTGSAAAIWRDGSWHYTRIVATGQHEDHYELSTGQIRQRSKTKWDLAQPPPDPSYWGDAVRERGCPQCETGTTWTACDCINTLDGQPFHGCDKCGGSGSRQDQQCMLCGGIGHIRHGVVITLADLNGYAHHINLTAEANAEVQQQSYNPLKETGGYQLPDTYRLSKILFDEGIDLADVVDPLGGPISLELLDGTATHKGADPTPLDVTRTYCLTAARGKPAARAFYIVKPPRHDKLPLLTAIAFGMGLDVAVTCVNADHYTHDRAGLSGTRWGVKLLKPDEELESATVSTQSRYLNAATGECFDKLNYTLNILNKPQPTQHIPVRQQLQPPHINLDGLGDALARLAEQHHESIPPRISARLSASRTRFILHTIDTPAVRLPDEILAEAPTTAEAITNLNL